MTQVKTLVSFQIQIAKQSAPYYETVTPYTSKGLFWKLENYLNAEYTLFNRQFQKKTSEQDTIEQKSPFDLFFRTHLKMEGGKFTVLLTQTSQRLTQVVYVSGE